MVMVDNLKQALQDCNTTCQELSTLLEQENNCLESTRDVKLVESNIKTKRGLTIQLEKFVNIIKVNFESMRTNQEFIKDLNIFKKLIEGYKTLAAKNAMLLRAAHTATSMILENIQKKTQRPAVKTYNAYGQVTEKQDSGPALINYSV
jgi:flagellar biosynthesis/type III secretory pathway chaperone